MPGTLADPVSVAVLRYLAQHLAATVFQIAPVARATPDRVQDALRELERLEFVRHAAGAIGPYGGVYYPTARGLRAVREFHALSDAM